MKIALSVALFSALVAAPLRAAEAGLDVKPVVVKVVETEAKITLQNIKPNVMAQWLQPEVFGVALVPVDESFGKIALSKDWKLVPNNSNNTLDVRYAGSGKGESIEKVRELVAALDKSIPQIEISMKLLQLSPEAARVLKLQTPEEAFTTLDDVDANFSAQLKKLIAEGKVRVVISSRITTFNKAKATIAESFQRFYVKQLNPDGTFLGYSPLVWQRSVDVTPTLQKNGKISVKYLVKSGYEPLSREKERLLPKLQPGAELYTGQITSHGIASQQEVNDGETLFIEGPHIFAGKPKADLTLDTLIELTARQIHRIDDPILADATSSTR